MQVILKKNDFLLFNVNILLDNTYQSNTMSAETIYQKINPVKRIFLDNIIETFGSVQIFGGTIRDIISEIDSQGSSSQVESNDSDLDIISPELALIFELMATNKTVNKKYHTWKDSLKVKGIKLGVFKEPKGSRYCADDCSSSVEFRHFRFTFVHDKITYPVDVINHSCGSNDFLCNGLSIKIIKTNQESQNLIYNLKFRKQEGFSIEDVIEDCKTKTARLVAPLATIYKNLKLYVKRTTNMTKKGYKYIGPILSQDFTEFAKYYLHNNHPMTVEQIIKETDNIKNNTLEFDKLHQVSEIDDKVIKIAIISVRKYIDLAKNQISIIEKFEKKNETYENVMKKNNNYLDKVITNLDNSIKLFCEEEISMKMTYLHIV